MFRTAMRSAGQRCYVNPMGASGGLPGASSSVLPVSSRAMSSFSTRHDNDPEILERGKKDALAKHHPLSKDEPHWHEAVASDSEAFVKAIRSEIKGAEKDVKNLVKASEEILKEARAKEEEEGQIEIKKSGT